MKAKKVKRTLRYDRISIIAIIVIVLFFYACSKIGDDEPAAAAPTPSASVSPLPSASPSPSPTPTPTPKPSPTPTPKPSPSPTPEPTPEPSPEPTPDTRPTKLTAMDMRTFVQENKYYCVPACVQSVLHFHGIDALQSGLAAEMYTSEVTGTEYGDAARVLNTYLFGNPYPAPGESGYRCVILQQNGTDDSVMAQLEQNVVSDLATNDPVLIALDMGTLYPELPHETHMLVIYGAEITEDGHITNYYMIDPYPGVQDQTFAGRKVFTSAEVQAALNADDEPAYIW